MQYALLLAAALVTVAGNGFAQPLAAAPNVTAEPPSRKVLTDRQWERVDEGIDRGLSWLASQQTAEGSFRTREVGQPGITSLGVMAFLSRGHLPGEGPYGSHIEKALKYVVDSQRVNGLLSRLGPDGEMVAPQPIRREYGVAGTYNHAISGLMLAEVYAMTGDTQNDLRIERTIERALEVTLNMQKWRKRQAVDDGGWRYLVPDRGSESDLSVVGWHLKFLRSAKNAGFEVPDEAIEDAVKYVLRCYDQQYGTFEYEVSRSDRRTRAMAGAGILALAHSSVHNRPEAAAAADWILDHGFENYNQHARFTHNYHSDRYHYGVFYCTQAMYQMGGRHWEQFYPATAGTLLANQRSNGSWATEGNHDTSYGSCYTTALVVLALGAPNQLLPIYQR